MAARKVTTPRGETVQVRRRVWPWPNFTRTDKLEAMGMAKPAAQWLGTSPRGDVVIAALALAPLLLFLAIGQLVVFTILAFLIVAALVTRYLAVPWTIEIVHEGEVVEKESVAGSAKANDKVNTIAKLYEMGAVRLPTPPPPEPPTITTALPRPDDAVVAKPDTEHDEPLPSPEQVTLPAPPRPPVPEPSRVERLEPVRITGDDVFAPEPETAFAIFDEPVFPKPVARPPAPELRDGETPLRRAIRLAEEEAALTQGLKKAEDLVEKKTKRKRRG